MKVIITGGAGFIGCNAAARPLRRGNDVVVLDSLIRKGSERNLAWLQTQVDGNTSASGAGGRGRTTGSASAGTMAGGTAGTTVASPAKTGMLTHVAADIRSREALSEVFTEHADAEVVLHLAGQVAVTTSVLDPRDDFEVNALGSFNVLEAARTLPKLRAFLFTSTNKVYGGMEDVGVMVKDGRYAYGTPELVHGVPETQPLDFHSPYGCSKGAADQYTIDYARIYDLPTVTMRQSAIYGERQMGVEDQGWVSWFCIRAAQGKPISIYGDGMQVRDLLWIDDLLDAYDNAIARIDHVKGQAFNLGGGPTRIASIGEVCLHLERLLGHSLDISYDEWRPGDQRVFIADTRKAQRDLDWAPKVGVTEGVERLFTWVRANLDLFQDM